MLDNQKHSFNCKTCRKVITLQDHIYKESYAGHNDCLSCRKTEKSSGMLDKATEPRDIEKDKGILELYADIRPISQIEEIASYYITKYEAQQARIAELERQLQLKQTKSHTQMLAEAFAAV